MVHQRHGHQDRATGQKGPQKDPHIQRHRFPTKVQGQQKSPTNVSGQLVIHVQKKTP